MGDRPGYVAMGDDHSIPVTAPSVVVQRLVERYAREKVRNNVLAKVSWSESPQPEEVDHTQGILDIYARVEWTLGWWLRQIGHLGRRECKKLTLSLKSEESLAITFRTFTLASLDWHTLDVIQIGKADLDSQARNIADRLVLMFQIVPPNDTTHIPKVTPEQLRRLVAWEMEGKEDHKRP